MRYKLLSKDEFLHAAAMGKAMLVDLRDKDDYDKWHLNGALNLDYSDIQDWSAHLDPSIPILLYCTHGNESILAARYLSSRGYYVGSLIGGIEEH